MVQSFSEVYGKRRSSQHQLSGFTYPEPDRTPKPYTSPVPALIERYIDYLDSRLAAGQDFQKAVSETPLPDHAFEDQIQRVRSRTLDFETAIRVVMFIEATGMSARDFASKSESRWFRQMLGMKNSISHPTPGNAKDRRFDFELRRFLRQFTDEAIRTGHTHGRHW